MPIPRVLTVAGSDSGGGAGIQADLKTFCSYRSYGMSVITALTAQNTVGVQGIHTVPPAFVAAQIDSVASDIGVDAVKTGMLADASIVEVVAERVSRWELHPLVVDPVMVAKSGDRLLRREAVEAVVQKLLPRTTVVTPNIPEAEVILDVDIGDLRAMKEAAGELLRLGPEVVVVKGGHLDDRRAVDVYCDSAGTDILSADRISTENTHGTGCTFASAVAAGMARGWDARVAVKVAKRFVTRAIREGLSLGFGKGPTNHLVEPEWPEGEGN